MQANPTSFTDFRVYLEDTDAGGIVYHANHLRYMERARREWLRNLNIAHYLNQDYQFVVHSCSLNYHKPLLMDNMIRVTIESIKKNSASLVMLQKIYLLDETDNSTKQTECASSAQIKLACINQQMKPIALPKEFINL